MKSFFSVQIEDVMEMKKMAAEQASVHDMPYLFASSNIHEWPWLCLYPLCTRIEICNQSINISVNVILFVKVMKGKEPVQ